MNKIEQLTFYRALNQLGVAKGDNLFVHSDLLRLGYPIIGPMMYLETLKQIIGPEGSIVAPAFTFSYMKTRNYHFKQTHPIEMGFISNQILDSDGTIRTKHPLHSVAIHGPLGAKYKDFETFSAYSEDGIFHKLLTDEVKILLLGATPSHISFSHLSEELYNVPYRKMLHVYGDVQFSENDCRKDVLFNFFARNLENHVGLGGYDTLVNELIDAGDWEMHKIGTCMLYFGTASVYVDRLNAKLHHNIHWLAENFER